MDTNPVVLARRDARSPSCPTGRAGPTSGSCSADGTGQRRVSAGGAGGHFLRWTQDGRAPRVPRGRRAPRRGSCGRVARRARSTPLPDVASGGHMSWSPDQSMILDVRGHKTLFVYPRLGLPRGGCSSSTIRTCGSTIPSGRRTAGTCCSTAPRRTAATSGCSTGVGVAPSLAPASAEERHQRRPLVRGEPTHAVPRASGPRRRATAPPRAASAPGRRAGSSCARSPSAPGRCPRAAACATRGPTPGSPADRRPGPGPMSCTSRSVYGWMTWLETSGTPRSCRCAGSPRGSRRSPRHGTAARPRWPSASSRLRRAGTPSVGCRARRPRRSRRRPRARGARTRGSCPSHDSAGNSDDVTPMSPLYAPAVCCTRFGAFAFQPNRPSTVRRSGLIPDEVGRRRCRRDCGRADRRARGSWISGTASSRPSPKTAGATRGREEHAGRQRRVDAREIVAAARAAGTACRR